MQPPELVERFCAYCARSLVPLQTPHLSSDCGKCGRTAYYVRHDPETGGIKVEAGERFTIPAGFIQLSLEPNGRGKLFRPGLPFLLKQFFLNQRPKSKEEVRDLLKSLEAEADAILKASPLFKDHLWRCTCTRTRNEVGHGRGRVRKRSSADLRRLKSLGLSSDFNIKASRAR